MDGGQAGVLLYLDYGCPYSYRAQRWLDAAGVAFDPRCFSLAEAHRPPGALPVWAAPPDRLEPATIAQAGHELVRLRGGDLVGYRRALFSLFHERGDGTMEELWELIARHAGGSVAEEELAEGLARLAASHQAAAAGGVFGTPTLFVGDAPGLFVKLADLPADGNADTLWEHVRGVATAHPELAELKQV